MRLIFLMLALLTTPALAQGWDHYGNARFGYGIDIPPGFSGLGESDNGDGQAFAADGKPIDLLVWGGNMMGTFDGEVGLAMSYAEDDAWSITYQASTPSWASFSGLKGSRILYQRMIALCDGSSYAAFRAEYSTTDAADMDPVIGKLVQSLRGDGC